MTNTASIITMAKYEHDFINQWLEHHINIGFSHFYILVDNIVDVQPEYKINPDFMSYVTLIYVEKKTLETYWGPIDFTVNFNLSCYLHQLINKLVIDKQLSKEVWITVIGIDQFIYLNNVTSLTIQDFLVKIDPACIQIFLPWSIVAFNNENENFDNLMQNVNSFKSIYGKFGGHGNGMIRSKSAAELSGDSHYFLSKEKIQKCYILNEYHDIPFNGPTWHIFKIADKIMQEHSVEALLNMDCLTSFHFVLRNKLECVIKACLFWNSASFRIDQIANSIKLKDKLMLFNDLRGNCFNKTITTNLIPNSYLPNTSIKNTNSYYVQILVDKLNINGFDISAEEVREWVDNLVFA